MARLELREVEKQFGPTRVIRGIDLEIGDGEFCVFVGPSGCGKSTLLRMIAGLETVSAGEIRIAGCLPPGRSHRPGDHANPGGGNAGKEKGRGYRVPEDHHRTPLGSHSETRAGKDRPDFLRNDG
jgi:ABC-type oligopeptide transport system ATPase subunit